MLVIKDLVKAKHTELFIAISEDEASTISGGSFFGGSLNFGQSIYSGASGSSGSFFGGSLNFGQSLYRRSY